MARATTLLGAFRYVMTVGMFVAAGLWIAAPASGGAPKVQLCHLPPGNPANAHTISVSTKAAEKHLANHPGDHLGECAPRCTDGSQCDDGDPCTINDCIDGACDFSQPVECQDGSICTAYECIAAEGGCVERPANEGGLCDDGAVCTHNDRCQVGTCAGDVIPDCCWNNADCEDGMLCTEDLCDETTGICSNPDIICEDAPACEVPICHPAVGCTTEQINCDDGDFCTVDSCELETGLCAYVPTGSPPEDPEESCDDGLDNDCDGLVDLEDVNDCRCGNGIIEEDLGEQCDDGNPFSGDGCDENCRDEICGNGFLQFGEDCDDGNNVGGDGCSANCTLEFCGDFVINGTEECDDGNPYSGDGCDEYCRVEICGNEILGYDAFGFLEQCDDGNNVSGDGCDASCFLEFCGDGIINNSGTEECDDGNNVDGDGCNADCTYQLCGGIAQLMCPPGFDCIDDPSDSCDPGMGGADCQGLCVPSSCVPTDEICADGLDNDCDGLVDGDDPDCEPLCEPALVDVYILGQPLEQIIVACGESVEVASGFYLECTVPDPFNPETQTSEYIYSCERDSAGRLRATFSNTPTDCFPWIRVYGREIDGCHVIDPSVLPEGWELPPYSYPVACCESGSAPPG